MPIKIEDVDLRKTDANRKRKIKYYTDKKSNVKLSDTKFGSSENKERERKSDQYHGPNPFIIIERKGNMLKAKRAHKIVKRNSSFFKKVLNSVELYGDMNTEVNNNNEQDITPDIDQGAVGKRFLYKINGHWPLKSRPPPPPPVNGHGIFPNWSKRRIQIYMANHYRSSPETQRENK